MDGYLPNLTRESLNIPTRGISGQNQWRTVRRVCNTASSHDGYKKMLEGVRRQFLEPAYQVPVSRLPDVPVPCRPPPSSSSPGRFSRNLQYTVKDRKIVKKEEEDICSPSLEALEENGRQHIIVNEVWERQVLKQMMIVRYVTFVLRDEIRDLELVEREQRGTIAFEEEKERYWLQHESDASVQLREYKLALSAKREKQKRLQENEALYRARSSSSPFPMNEFKMEPDAQKILQEYLKMKHLADDGEGQSQECPHPPLRRSPQQQRSAERYRRLIGKVSSHNNPPVVRVQPLSNVCNTLGIAAYMGLLEKDSESRKMIEEREEEEYKRIMEHFEEQSSLLLTWKHKRLHLERLIYWKAQSEERRQKEQLRIEMEVLRPRKQMAMPHEELAAQEEEFRNMLGAEEGTRRGDLLQLHNEYFMRTKVKALGNEEMNLRAHILQEDIGVRKLLVQGLEIILRQGICKEWEQNVVMLVPEQIQALAKLNREWIEHEKQILTIQRAVRSFRAGRLGWRITHSEIGRIIQKKRDIAKIDRGKKSLCEYKNYLASEFAAVEEEVRTLHANERNKLFDVEYNSRTIVYTEEEWNRGVLRRAERQDLYDSVIVPLVTNCFSAELDARREIDVEEEFVRGRMCNFFNRLSNIIRTKTYVLGREVEGRAAIEKDENNFFFSILCMELDDRDLVRIMMKEIQAQKEEELFAQALVLLESRKEEEMYMYARLTRLHYEFKREKLEIEALDPNPRALTAHTFLNTALCFFCDESVEFLENYGSLLVEQHSEIVYLCCVAVTEEREEEARHLLERLESRAWPEITDCAHREMSSKLRKELRNIGAASRIKIFYRKYRNGDVGRSGMRKHLREAFRVMREKAELKEVFDRQRIDVQECRHNLRDAVAIQSYYTYRRIALELSVVENRAEPRGRSELEGQEEMMFKMILNYFEPPAVPMVDAVTILLHSESHGRIRIKKEWQKAIENDFTRRKEWFEKDVLAIITLRKWQKFAAVKRKRTFIKAELEKLVLSELTQRHELELNEANERFIDIVKPMEYTTHHQAYLDQDVPRFLNEMCFDIGFHLGIKEEEWQNRMLLLWRMRNSYHEKELETEEFATRAALQQSSFYDGVDLIEVVCDESILRAALCDERRYFLMRILARLERASRGDIIHSYDIHSLCMHEYTCRKELYVEYIYSLHHIAPEKNTIQHTKCLLIDAEISHTTEAEKSYEKSTNQQPLNDNPEDNNITSSANIVDQTNATPQGPIVDQPAEDLTKAGELDEPVTDTEVAEKEPTDSEVIPEKEIPDTEAAAEQSAEDLTKAEELDEPVADTEVAEKEPTDSEVIPEKEIPDTEAAAEQPAEDLTKAEELDEPVTDTEVAEKEPTDFEVIPEKEIPDAEAAAEQPAEDLTKAEELDEPVADTEVAEKEPTDSEVIPEKEIPDTEAASEQPAEDLTKAEELDEPVTDTEVAEKEPTDSEVIPEKEIPDTEAAAEQSAEDLTKAEELDEPVTDTEVAEKEPTDSEVISEKEIPDTEAAAEQPAEDLTKAEELDEPVTDTEVAEKEPTDSEVIPEKEIPDAEAAAEQPAEDLTKAEELDEPVTDTEVAEKEPTDSEVIPEKEIPDTEAASEQPAEDLTKAEELDEPVTDTEVAEKEPTDSEVIPEKEIPDAEAAAEQPAEDLTKAEELDEPVTDTEVAEKEPTDSEVIPEKEIPDTEAAAEQPAEDLTKAEELDEPVADTEVAEKEPTDSEVIPEKEIPDTEAAAEQPAEDLTKAEELDEPVTDTEVAEKEPTDSEVIPEKEVPDTEAAAEQPAEDLTKAEELDEPVTDTEVAEKEPTDSEVIPEKEVPDTEAAAEQSAEDLTKAEELDEPVADTEVAEKEPTDSEVIPEKEIPDTEAAAEQPAEDLTKAEELDEPVADTEVAEKEPTDSEVIPEKEIPDTEAAAEQPAEDLTKAEELDEPVADTEVAEKEPTDSEVIPEKEVPDTEAAAEQPAEDLTKAEELDEPVADTEVAEKEPTDSEVIPEKEIPDTEAASEQPAEDLTKAEELDEPVADTEVAEKEPTDSEVIPEKEIPDTEAAAEQSAEDLTKAEELDEPVTDTEVAEKEPTDSEVIPEKEIPDTEAAAEQPAEDLTKAEELDEPVTDAEVAEM